MSRTLLISVKETLEFRSLHQIVNQQKHTVSLNDLHKYLKFATSITTTTTNTTTNNTITTIATITTAAATSILATNYYFFFYRLLLQRGITFLDYQISTPYFNDNLAEAFMVRRLCANNLIQLPFPRHNRYAGVFYCENHTGFINIYDY